MMTPEALRKGMTVLVVDDDADIRSTLEEVLTDEGYAVVAAANGLDALAILRAGERPCVILLDLMMPVMDGYRFREAQVRDERLATIPVVVMTAGSHMPRSQFDGHGWLAKPLRLRDLMTAIDARCALRRRN